jgi:hypothetical protein
VAEVGLVDPAGPVDGHELAGRAGYYGAEVVAGIA